MFSPRKNSALEGRILPPPIGFLAAERRPDWPLAEGKQAEAPPPHLLSGSRRQKVGEEIFYSIFFLQNRIENLY